MTKPFLRTGPFGKAVFFLLVALATTSGTCANYDKFHQRSSVGGMTEYELFPMAGTIGLMIAAVGFAALIVAEIVVRIPHDRSRWPGLALGTSIFTGICIILSGVTFPLFAILAAAGAFAAMVSILLTTAPKDTPQ